MSALPRCPVLGRVTLEPCPVCRCPRSLEWPVGAAEGEPGLDLGELTALRHLLPLLRQAAMREGADLVVELIDLHADTFRRLNEPAPDVPTPAGPLARVDQDQP